MNEIMMDGLMITTDGLMIMIDGCLRRHTHPHPHIGPENGKFNIFSFSRFFLSVLHIHSFMCVGFKLVCCPIAYVLGLWMFTLPFGCWYVLIV